MSSKAFISTFSVTSTAIFSCLKVQTDFALYKRTGCALETKDLAGRMLLMWPAQSTVQLKMWCCIISWVLSCHCFHCWNFLTVYLFPQLLYYLVALCLVFASQCMIISPCWGFFCFTAVSLISFLCFSPIPDTTQTFFQLQSQREQTSCSLPHQSSKHLDPVTADIGRVMMTPFRCHELLLWPLGGRTDCPWHIHSITRDMQKWMGIFSLSKHTHKGMFPLSKCDSEAYDIENIIIHTIQ